MNNSDDNQAERKAAMERLCKFTKTASITKDESRAAGGQTLHGLWG